MKAIKEKIVSRKINWLALSVLVLMISVVFTSNIVEASIFNWFDDTKSQTEFLNNSLYRPYLKKYNGDFLSQFGIWLGWAVVKGMFTVTDSIQNMIPDVLDLFNFIESTGLNNVYQSVINTIVVGLMILSLMFVGYKMITGKGTIDLRSVGMNIVMSVALILLMPTMISSGIQFAKIFYNDATTITNSDDGVAWSLIKQGVTDLAYINKTDQYSSIDKTEDRNKLTRKNFQQTDLTQVLTDKVIDKLEKGFALVSINKQVLYRTNEFFHQTDTYTPIRLPQHFIGQEEYEQLIMVFENVSSETELSYMKKTVNESNEVDTSWNFKIQPKLEMTLYYQGDVKSSHEKVPYSNTSFRVTSIEESIKIKDFEGEFFLMTREKEAYERFISLFTDRFNQAFHTDYATNIFEDFENSYSYSVISNTDVY
ncbi:TPA: TrbC/VirB2 family protein, partial [Enterococcus faecium]